MKDYGVYIRVHFRREGDLVFDGVNVTYPPAYSHFVYIRRGYKQVWIRIPKDNPKDYTLSEEEWDPKLQLFKPSAFSSDANT